MKAIKCKNVYIDESGKEVECGRILGTLTDMQVDMLKLDPEGGPIFRCPKCSPDHRWVKVSGNNDGAIFEVLQDHPELSEELKYNELIICQQVG